MNKLLIAIAIIGASITTLALPAAAAAKSDHMSKPRETGDKSLVLFRPVPLSLLHGLPRVQQLPIGHDHPFWQSMASTSADALVIDTRVMIGGG